MPGYTNDEIGAALTETKGMVYVAATRLGCSPNTIKRRLSGSPALRELVAAARGLMIDTAELRLAKAIQEGEPWAIQFYLKTQGRDRGYGDHLEITVRQQAEALALALAAEGITVTPDELERDYQRLKALVPGHN